MNTVDDAGPVRYGGWSTDRPGWFFGLSAGSALTVVAGGAPVLLAAAGHRWLLALALVPGWAVLVVLVAVPVRGRSALRWALDSLHRRIGAVMGWSDWQSRAAAGGGDDLDDADLPGVLAGVRVHDGPPSGPLLTRPALIADHAARTWAVTARITHPGIGLAETAARTRMGQGLSELLDGAASAGLVSVIALQVRTAPDDGAQRAAWQRTHLHRDAPPAAVAAHADLAAVLTRAGVVHEAFLTVVVPERRITTAAKEAGGGVDGRGCVLHGVMTEVESRLLGPVGCTTVTWLDTPALAAAVRTGFAPDGPSGSAGDVPVGAAGPSSAPPPDRRSYGHDAWRTATCTVLLPDKGAVMGALAPVLAPSAAGERRCVTVFFEPVPHARADRMIGQETMTSDLAAELRRKGGFQARAAHRRDQARVDVRDARLADGNALIRVAAAAAVTVPDGWSITDHARRLEAAITGSGFTPLRLDLAQDSGFAAACIPLGVGLPQRRGLR